MNEMRAPTDILKEEHQAVLAKLVSLEESIHGLGQREKVAAALRSLASFFDKDFWVHFDKEERGLFPEFDSFMPRGAGPLAVMIEEHEVLRRTNAVMQRAIAAYLADNDDSPQTRQTILQNGAHFIDFLRDHIYKEDNILFQMARMHLTQAQNERAVRLFGEIEKAGQDSARQREKSLTD